MNPFVSNRPFNTKGQSFVELAMVMPVVLALALGGIEYTNLYVMSLRAASISREASNMAFRQCRGLGQSQMDLCLDKVLAEINGTLIHVMPKFALTHQVAEEIEVEDEDGCLETETTYTNVPNGTIILTAWKVGPVSTRGGAYYDTALVPPGKSDSPDAYGKPLLWSRRSIGGDRDSRVHPYLNALATISLKSNPFVIDYSLSNQFFYGKGGYMFVAEVFCKYDPIAKFIKSFAGGNTQLLPDELYEVGFF